MRRLLFLLALLWPLTLSAQTYTLAPSGYFTVQDLNGKPISGACVWTYTAGTSTPVATYTTSAGIANSNPIQADSAGRFVAYLAPGSSYKFVYEGACTPPAHGTTIRTQDNIAAVGLGSVQANDVGSCEGRITLTSGIPITPSDVTAATTIFFTPYHGNVCSTYDPVGGSWTLTTFAEVSLSLGSDTAAKNYDLFGFSSSGVFTLERLVWTNDTTRATSLTIQDGVLVKAGQTSRRYLGTYRTTAVAGNTEDSTVNRFVWNNYNRAPRSLKRFETTASWTYTTQTWRQANGATANQLNFVTGISEDQVIAWVQANYGNSNIGVGVAVSVGLDSTTAPSADSAWNFTYSTAAGGQQLAAANYSGYPGLGKHSLMWLEESVATPTTTWFGTTNAATGMYGTVVQ